MNAHTIAASSAGLIARTAVVLLLGWAGAGVFRRGPAALRHLIWLCAIVGVLVLPAVASVGRIPLGILPSAAPGADHSPVGASGGDRSTAGIVTSGIVSPPQPRAPHDSAPAEWSGAVALWLGVAGILVASLLAGSFSMRRIVGGSRAIESSEWLAALADCRARLGVARSPRLVMSDRVEMAFTCTVFRPVIVLPRSADEWTMDRRRAVLLHEVAHLRRHDLIAHSAGAIMCALYWFNPLAWLAARRLRAESELACDDLVLTAGVRASDYAQHLLDLVATLAGRAGVPAGALAMARPTGLEQRLHAILDSGRLRAAPRGLRSILVVGSMSVLAIATAAVAPVPRHGRQQVAASAGSTPTTPITGAGGAPIGRSEPPAPLAQGDTDAFLYFSGPVDPRSPALQDSLKLGPAGTSILLNGDLALLFTPGKGARPYIGNEISADSARIVLGDRLFRDLRSMLTHAPAGAVVVEGDWALPPRSVTAVRADDQAVGTGPTVTNGLNDIVRSTPGSPLDAASLRTVMGDTHMNPNADFFLDEVPTTPTRARAALDSGIVISIEVIKPRALPVTDYNACCIPPINGAIKLTTRH